MLNRRGFLGSLSAFAAQCALDPERALWVPGKKLISIPNPTPHPRYLLELGGQAVFPVYGQNGLMNPGMMAYYIERSDAMVQVMYVAGSAFDAFRKLPSLPTKSMADLNKKFRLTDNRGM